MTARTTKSIASGARRDERAVMWRLPDLTDLELLKAHYTTQDFAPHTHDGFAVGVIEDGAQVFECQGKTYTAGTGTVVAINPGEVHTGHAADRRGWTYRMMYPEPKWFVESANQVGRRGQAVPFFRTPVMADPPLAARLRRLHCTLEHPGCALERDALLVATFAYMVATHSSVRTRQDECARRHPAVATIREVLHSDFGSRLRLGELAAMVDLSPFYLLRIFRRETGLPPHRYLEQVRVKQAQRLLRGGMSPSQAAYVTGFSDQSHLTRTFKRIVGVPPGKYASGHKIPLARSASPADG